MGNTSHLLLLASARFHILQLIASYPTEHRVVNALVDSFIFASPALVNKGLGIHVAGSSQLLDRAHDKELLDRSTFFQLVLYICFSTPTIYKYAENQKHANLKKLMSKVFAQGNPMTLLRLMEILNRMQEEMF